MVCALQLSVCLPSSRRISLVRADVSHPQCLILTLRLGAVASEGIDISDWAEPTRRKGYHCFDIEAPFEATGDQPEGCSRHQFMCLVIEECMPGGTNEDGALVSADALALGHQRLRPSWRGWGVEASTQCCEVRRARARRSQWRSASRGYS